jgi:hypothetical protein
VSGWTQPAYELRRERGNQLPTQEEIARQLSISPKTVGTHLQKLMSKLGVHSRAELVARAFRVGLVSEIQGRREAARLHNGPRAL